MTFFTRHRLSRRPAILTGALAATILAGALAAAWLLPAAPHAAVDNPGPQALWVSTLPDASGQAQTLSQYKGHPLVVNFWASWCGPCVQEMPELSAMSSQYSQKGIQFIGIGIDSAENINRFFDKFPKRVSYPIYVAGFSGADLARALGNSAGGLPFTVVIDASGKVRYTKLGQVDAGKLRQALSTL